MSSTLHIRLLGEFSLLCDDAPLTTVNTPRLQSLLAYLVLHRDVPQPRQQLAFLLWPDSSESQARTNLRNLIHQLRQALPQANTVQWRPDAPFALYPSSDSPVFPNNSRARARSGRAPTWAKIVSACSRCARSPSRFPISR